MAVPLGTLGRAATLGFVAELGDKTFFLTAALAAWCPLAGIRSKSTAFFQQCLVLMGAVLALSLHIALNAVLPGFLGSERSFFDWSLGSLAVAGQGAMGLQALLELRKADRKRKDSSAAAKLVSSRSSSTSQVQTPSTEPQNDPFHPCGFLGTFKAYNPEDYAADKGERGTLPPAAETDVPEIDKESSCRQSPFEEEVAMPASSYGTINTARVMKKEASNQVCSALAALILPFLTVFLAEAGDKSLEALQKVHPTAMIGFGTAAGYLVSSFVAVLLGFVLERQLTERRLLFAIASGLWAMVLVTSSQALLHFYTNYSLRRQASPPQ